MNLLLAINDDYIEQTIVLLFSIFKNNKNEKLFFYFLDGRLSKKNKRRIVGFVRKNGGCVRFVPVNNVAFKNAPQRKNISVETYYRLLAFELLPQVDKILYLDADILVTGSLKNLYQTDIEEKCIAGVQDQGDVQRDKLHKQRLGLSASAPYINGGVLLMNLKRLRSVASTEKILEYIESMKDVLKYQDQDVVNGMFADEIKIVPKKYNMSPLYSDKKDFQDYFLKKRKYPTVIHYMGEKTKPWKESFYGYKYLRIYYGYCKMAGNDYLVSKLRNAMLLRPIAIVKQYEKDCGMEVKYEK